MPPTRKGPELGESGDSSISEEFGSRCGDEVDDGAVTGKIKLGGFRTTRDVTVGIIIIR